MTPLTPRQTEVLRLLAEGHTDQQIARTLGITHMVVRKHAGLIYRALGLYADDRNPRVLATRWWLAHTNERETA